ncbi:hypothetical protein V1477_009778 [Vespula maculifrons]|uniref:Uncharacterized protein n=1 Tax=Vespula maculifrons TaxID=7453 RepID=A0ABD2CAQ6_VESMC
MEFKIIGFGPSGGSQLSYVKKYHNSIEFEGDNNDENEETNRGKGKFVEELCLALLAADFL